MITALEFSKQLKTRILLWQTSQESINGICTMIPIAEVANMIELCLEFKDIPGGPFFDPEDVNELP